MKSPFTGKEMNLVYESRTWSFRGEEYTYMQASWLCQDTGEKFTTDEMDDTSFIQVANQYRAKYGIPYTDEIIAIRQRYGISAAKISSLLGLGANQWRLYESGEVPNVSNGRMIRSIMNPSVFQDYINSSERQLDEKEYSKLKAKISAIADEKKEKYETEHYAHSRIFQCKRGSDNGFAPQSLDRLKNILLYITNKYGEVFYTKMNKILFYSDFLSYRKTGMSITGLSYRALNFGPAPERWDRIYSQFDEITQEPRYFSGIEGWVLVSNTQANISSLSETELQIIDEICTKFAHCSSSEISNISHMERAWIECNADQKRIPFSYAFDLKAI